MANITATTSERLCPVRDADVTNDREETEFGECLVCPLQEIEILQNAIICAINEMGKCDLPLLDKILIMLAD